MHRGWVYLTFFNFKRVEETYITHILKNIKNIREYMWWEKKNLTKFQVFSTIVYFFNIKISFISYKKDN